MSPDDGTNIAYTSAVLVLERIALQLMIVERHHSPSRTLPVPGYVAFGT